MGTMAGRVPTGTVRRRNSRSFWLKQLHMWHWMSSAVSLVGLLLFAITGITLNHAAEIEATPVVVEREDQLPPALLEELAAEASGLAALPGRVASWLRETHGVRAPDMAEWSADEVYLALPRPGGDGWVAIDRASGLVMLESADRGAIAFLNDLHKGRNTGTVWKWFIDIIAVACLVFALTGLVLLHLHSAKRRSTWPITGFGLLAPVIIVIFFLH